MGACKLGSDAWMNALKEHCVDYVDRLYDDAGVTDGMTRDEVNRRISAEHRRREELAEQLEAEASFWRAVQRRNREP